MELNKPEQGQGGWRERKRSETFQRIAQTGLNPFHRQILLEAAGGYAFGNFHWLARPHLTLERRSYPPI